MKTAQKEKILNHLSDGHSITAVEALIVFKCFRLAARIKEIRSMGIEIRTEMKNDAEGVRYACYSLA